MLSQLQPLQRRADLVGVHPVRYRPAMLTSSEVEAVVSAYVAAVHDRDRDRFIGLFSGDAVACDPYPDAAFHGPEGIAKWWDTIIAPMATITFDVHDVHVCGDRAAMVWTIDTSPDGKTWLQLRGVDIFTVGDDSKIASLHAYWDPTRFSTIARPTP